MSRWPPTLIVVRVLPCALLLFGTLAHAEGGWDPLTPQELALKASVVEPDADAEVIFWRGSVEDRFEGGNASTVISHYLRIKVFTPAGAEKFSSVSIVTWERAIVSEVKARTIRPDGSIVPLSNKAVFSTTLMKSSEGKVRSTRFALPAVEPGCIIEYRYYETRPDQFSHNVRLQLQQDIPVQRVSYSIKPFASEDYVMRYVAFHAAVSKLADTGGGFYTIGAEHLPAFVEEPDMPPEEEVRAWLFIYYSPTHEKPLAGFWKDVGRASAQEFAESTRPNGDLHKLAVGVVRDATTAEDRLRRLFDWCRAEIHNRTEDELKDAPASRDRTKANKTSADVLASRAGTAYDINMLFAALARAAGFEVRLARVASRNRRFFNFNVASEYFLDSSDIAVRLDGRWRFFDPGSSRVPYGELLWQEEGGRALICDEDSLRFADIPVSDPERATRTRLATLRLEEDGSLEGDVTLRWTGHLRHDEWLDAADQSTAERTDQLTQHYQAALGAAQISNVHFDDGADRDPLTVATFHVRVADYAQRTGKRLLLQPCFFEHGSSPRFSSSTRRYPVYFHYPWVERDTVTVELPPGYAVGEAAEPEPVELPGIGRYVAYMRLTTDARRLVYARSFRFGDGEAILFPSDSYSGIKQAFDTIEHRDGITLPLFDPRAGE